jgi:hypothetical protein
MTTPVICGTIERRILVNFRVDPKVLRKLLPAPFRPQLVQGWAVAGICLIRLKHVRLPFVPKALGLRSENAAHRIAVEWECDGELQSGVYVLRRDTSSWLNCLVGGRLFPGFHQRARFQVDEGAGKYRIVVDSEDANMRLSVSGHAATQLPVGSVFASVEDASDFFARGSLGYSPTQSPGEFEGLELRSSCWRAEAFECEKVESSYFEDRSLFPPGSVTFDSALLMQEIRHQWRAREAVRPSPLQGSERAGL